MASISLLPEVIKEQRKKKRQLHLISIGVFVLAIIFALIVVYLTYMTRDVNDQVAAVESKANQVESRIDELQAYRESYDQVVEAIGLIEEDLEDIPNWQAILVELSESIPANSWLTELSMSYEDGDDDESLGQLNLYAYTVDYAELTTWLEDLGNTPLFGEVRYEFLEKTTYGDMELDSYVYEIEAEVVAEEFGTLLWGKGEENNEE